MLPSIELNLVIIKNADQIVQAVARSDESCLPNLALLNLSISEHNVGQEIFFQHPSPYYDDSYAVNSPNVGPYQDAIMQELIPKIEKEFRIIQEPYARILS